MLRRFRIPVQLAFLALFLGLLALTVGTGRDRLGPPVRIFLEIDPMVGLTTWLRTWAWPGLLWLSLITLGLSVLLGRFFCGWVCPLGTLSQIAGRLRLSRRDERKADRWHPAQRWKTWILLFVLAAALSGTQWGGLLDPPSILIRGLALGFGPALDAGVRGAANLLAQTPVSWLSEPAYRFVRDHSLAPHPPRFTQGLTLATALLALLGFSWFVRRFWCRYLCPLGALLGLAARAGSLRLGQDESRCTSCSLCTFHCQGAADPDLMGSWRPAECFVCGNCTASCRQAGLAFALTKPRIWVALGRVFSKPTHSQDHSVERRRLLLAAGLGLVTGPVGRIAPAREHPPADLIRPPGAGPESAFLDRCLRCGECMKVCIGNGLHPAGLEAGLPALWSPVLRPRLGYCEYQCTLCGQVCPSGAIPRLTPTRKVRTVLGLAAVDQQRCLPFARATPCIVCEEQCPTSPKAIVLEDVEAVALDGTVHPVRRPRVDLSRCVGCGICEFRCPVEGEAAIRITAVPRID